MSNTSGGSSSQFCSSVFTILSSNSDSSDAETSDLLDSAAKY